VKGQHIAAVRQIHGKSSRSHRRADAGLPRMHEYAATSRQQKLTADLKKPGAARDQHAEIFKKPALVYQISA
jgi:hypothetical protein